MARSPETLVPRRSSGLVRHHQGKRHNLGPDEKEAKRKFHALMAAPEPKAAPAHTRRGWLQPSPRSSRNSSNWCGKHRSPKTYEWTQYRIQMFINILGESVHMPAASSEAVPCRWNGWIGIPTLSVKIRQVVSHLSPWHHAAVQRPFNWAVSWATSTRTPSATSRSRPSPAAERSSRRKSGRRSAIITRKATRSVDLLEFAWETGMPAAGGQEDRGPARPDGGPPRSVAQGGSQLRRHLHHRQRHYHQLHLFGGDRSRHGDSLRRRRLRLHVPVQQRLLQRPELRKRHAGRVRRRLRFHRRRPAAMGLWQHRPAHCRRRSGRCYCHLFLLWHHAHQRS